MTKHDDRVYLDHIREMIRRIDASVGSDRQRFDRDIDAQDATLRRLQVLAESTRRLSEELKSRYPAIPWRQIAGFRNVAVHAYLGIDLDLVWQAVVELPPLARLADDEISRLDRELG
jgi:uncharacterized protein with HEPN domain